jgi:cbb3-type cytochrome oxidase cytochrome c subunit
MPVHRFSRFLLLCGLCLAAVFIVAGCSTPGNGEKLFFRQGCSQCHSFQGRGGNMGPDLSAVINSRGAAWVDRYLQDPKKMNRLSRMPSFQHLSRRQRWAIIAFLKH